MALKLIRRHCALSITVLVVLLALQAFVTHSAARPLATGDKTAAQDDEFMTSAEMEKRYVRPEGAVEAEIEGAGGDEGDHGSGGIEWDRGEWNEGGGWDEGGNWDRGGGWNNRPPWAAPDANLGSQ